MSLEVQQSYYERGNDERPDYVSETQLRLPHLQRLQDGLLHQMPSADEAVHIIVRDVLPFLRRECEGSEQLRGRAIWRAELLLTTAARPRCPVRTACELDVCR